MLTFYSASTIVVNVKIVCFILQVLYERPGELVAQFKFTALLLPSGTHRITGLPFDKSQCKTDRTIKDQELNVNIFTDINYM